MKTVDDYLLLLPSESQDLPKLNAVISALVEPFSTQQALVDNIPVDFGLDTAVGAQLDIVGEWVGMSRVFPVPVTGVYFEWDGAADVGWNVGLWQGEFDPNTGPRVMNDTDYRRLLRTKILINNWDGSYEQLSTIWDALLPEGRLGIVIDGQDMTMSLGYEGEPITGLQLAVLTIGLGLIKPAGVRIRDVFSSTGDNPVFSWDSDGRGWEEASWSTLINV